MLEETETIRPTGPVPKMLDNLKQVYGHEKSLRGRVLLSQAIKVLENYQYWARQPGITEPSIGVVKSVLVRKRIIPKRVQTCLWCGSKRVRKIAEWPKEGFNEYKCKGCGQKFFR